MSSFVWRIYRPVATKIVSYTLTNADSNGVFDNRGDTTVAPGTVFQLLTTSTLNLGTSYTIINQTIGGLQLKAAATDILRFPGSDSSLGGTQTCTTIGGAITVILSSNGFWNVISGVSGTWTGA